MKIELKFKINITDYILSTFDKKIQTGLKCAYLPVEAQNVDSFETQKCDTDLIDENGRMIFSTSTNQVGLSEKITDILNGQQ